ncbi:hypothetical protein EXU85_16570 [Spirosoma sp. KCTC 42546]|uniref:hypothetical protein n=1 Tax=Spirosoma sp. KCTC 42546 TaxID=2520506 RepID=UPI00115C398C|nr:hypothetical protein [Spirosoma sp. KCTC 42546]QDK80130.1 hypothetical protein EXU85_16570 [Spirosoma sp. KCTC 42546]
MNTTRLLHCFAYLFLLIGFWGCTDHRIPVAPGASRLRVKTIIQEGPNGTSKISAFNYDSQGRLSLIIGYQAPDSSTTPVENTVFQYDGQNRLTQARREVVRRASSSPNPFELYRYGYNGAGLVDGVGFSSSSMGAVTRWNATLQYNGANKAVGSSEFFDIPGVTITSNSSYVYTGNNITSVTTTSTLFRNTPFTTTSTTTYAFDTNVNPFYGVFVIPKLAQFAFPPSASLNDNTYFGGLRFLSTLSQNNILSAIDGGGGVTLYSYTYNAANLPTKRVTAAGNSVLETLYFEYENY